MFNSWWGQDTNRWIKLCSMGTLRTDIATTIPHGKCKMVVALLIEKLLYGVQFQRQVKTIFGTVDLWFRFDGLEYWYPLPSTDTVSTESGLNRQWQSPNHFSITFCNGWRWTAKWLIYVRKIITHFYVIISVCNSSHTSTSVNTGNIRRQKLNKPTSRFDDFSRTFCIEHSRLETFTSQSDGTIPDTIQFFGISSGTLDKIIFVSQPHLVLLASVNIVGYRLESLVYENMGLIF